MASAAMLAPKQAVPGSAGSDRSPRANSASSFSAIAADARTLERNRSSSNAGSFGMGRDLISYIFPDFKAVEYFCKEFISLNEFHILENTESSGFEIYLVDQWIRDRRIGSVASVFTGNSQSKVKVCKFTVVKRQSRDYPPRFQEYLNELLLNHATFKKMSNATTDLEYSSSNDTSDIPAYLLVTNISAMPHDLFLVPIPGGDALAFEHRYMVNSNLKKLNCGGRSFSLISEKISDASEDKFRQMYHIFNESVPIHFAILELVNLVQTCLFYFDLLDAKYADGLLCHKTEDAIKSWWNLIGLPHFNYKPHHKSEVLSSRSVAAILSLTVSVKLRMQLIGGCDVPKDLFDAEGFMISVGNFQKQVKIEKSRKLNMVTLSRLFSYTNQGNQAEKFNTFYSPFGNESSLNESESTSIYDQSYMTSPSAGKGGGPSNGLLQGQAASAYRRNKIHYSKELKKFTNVVKNTVQDHIMVKEDADDLYPDPSITKPTAKLKNKIVSKLSDTIEPADIETTNIEAFAKKCVVGKTLSRLWLGLSPADAKLILLSDDDMNPSSSSANITITNGGTHQKNDSHHHHHHHRHHRRRNREGQEALAGRGSQNNGGYGFISLRESFTTNQDPLQVADKSGRLGRMKLSFQTRKAPAKAEYDRARNSSFGTSLSNNELYGSLLDTELQKLGDTPISHNETRNGEQESIDFGTSSNHIRTLRRRASFPATKNAVDSNLITLQGGQRDDSDMLAVVPKKTASFSALENYFHKTDEMTTHERTRNDYYVQVSAMLSLESIKKKYSSESFSSVAMKSKQADIEARKIYNSHSSLLQRKLRFSSEYEAVLNYRMKDLADNLDKMAFRSRDLVKKIDELDEHINIFESKINSESVAKLDGMIDKVIHSAKFDIVFEDPDEKLVIVKSLTGAETLEEDWNSSNKKVSAFWQLAVFLYEILMTMLRLFRFDRSKMNLDRIRGQYKKLDPNREYLSKLYKLVGRESRSAARDDLQHVETDGQQVATQQS